MPDEDTSVAAPSTASAEPAGGGIKTAAEVIEKVLAEPKAPATATGKVEPARRVEKLEAKAAEKATITAPEPDADATALGKARFHLQHGDVAKAIDAAFGALGSKDVADGVREALARKLGVNSGQWEKVRKYEAGVKRAAAAREQELSGIVDQLKTEYAPFHAARAAYKAGDYDAAFKAAFGEDAADYQRKVISQRVGKNPEIEKLRAELDAERADARKRAEAEATAKAEAEEQAAIAGYVSNLGKELAASDDPAVRKYAARPAFVNRVYEIQRANYDRNSNTTIPTAIAAQHARDEILASLQQWSVDDTATGASPAKAAQASALPAKPPVAKAPARALKQSQAAEASGQPQKLTSAQIREKYQRQMETATD